MLKRFGLAFVVVLVVGLVAAVAGATTPYCRQAATGICLPNLFPECPEGWLPVDTCETPPPAEGSVVPVVLWGIWNLDEHGPITACTLGQGCALFPEGAKIRGLKWDCAFSSIGQVRAGVIASPALGMGGYRILHSMASWSQQASAPVALNFEPGFLEVPPGWFVWLYLEGPGIAEVHVTLLVDPVEVVLTPEGAGS